MAEILLSLTIIGVVAAITLPSLTGNINERTWNTQRKALYARFSQALALMPSLNSYGTLRAPKGTEGTDSYDAGEDTAAMTFITDGLTKVMKINNICDNEHLEDCGIPKKYTNLLGSTSSFPQMLSEYNSRFKPEVRPYISYNSKAAAFETQNGESILLYYNPKCREEMFQADGYYTQPEMCANFIYDLNGTKGPNTVGKDIGFITALHPTDPIIIAPVPLSKNQERFSGNLGQMCRNQDSNSRPPNYQELMAMFYNRDLLGITGGDYLSGSTIMVNGERKYWIQSFNTGSRNYSNLWSASLRCVKR